MITKSCLNVLSFLGFFFFWRPIKFKLECDVYGITLSCTAEPNDSICSSEWTSECLSLSLHVEIRRGFSVETRRWKTWLKRRAHEITCRFEPWAFLQMGERFLPGTFHTSRYQVYMSCLPFVVHFIYALNDCLFSEPATRPSTQNGLNPDLFKKKSSSFNGSRSSWMVR